MGKKEMGTLYGVGVGPADANLMTLKAIDIIKKSDVIFIPVKDKEKCRAYATVKKVITDIDEKIVAGIDFPMTKDSALLEETYGLATKIITGYLQECMDVAFINIGDISIYSTFGYVGDCVKECGYNVEYISGIPSFVAVSAALNIPLSQNNEQIHIIPGSYDVSETFCLKGTKIYMKSGKKLGELVKKLKEYENIDKQQIFAVANCGLPNQQLAYNLEELEKLDSYLTTVILKEK